MELRRTAALLVTAPGDPGAWTTGSCWKSSALPVRFELLVAARCNFMACSYSSGNPEGGGMVVGSSGGPLWSMMRLQRRRPSPSS